MLVLEVGIYAIDDFTNANGLIRPKEFADRFKVEVRKELENLARIKVLYRIPSVSRNPHF